MCWAYYNSFYSPQTKFAKCVWIVLICLSFFGAWSLISQSYNDWSSHPVATSISTHPISDLDFPTVTVCPPKGSHTALNYDLAKADNESLTEKDRTGLKKDIFEIFLEPFNKDFVRNMIATTNPENIKDVYDGFQSVPSDYDRNSGFEVRMWKAVGSWHTP